jgi:hypothetical protein
MATLLEEDKISLDALCNILKSASLDAKIIDNSVYLDKVNPSDPHSVACAIGLDKLNRFLTLGEGLSLVGKDAQLDAFINRLNLNELVPSFYWSRLDVEEEPEEAWLNARYFMPITGGLIDEQFVSMVQRFGTEVTDGLAKYDTDKLFTDWD